MKDLLYGLKRTQAIQVFVQFDDVVAEVGEEKANELALLKVAMRDGEKPAGNLVEEAENMKVSRIKSVAPFKRVDLVAAIEEARNATPPPEEEAGSGLF